MVKRVVLFIIEAKAYSRDKAAKRGSMDLANKKPLLMTAEDWKNVTDYHICNNSLVKGLFLDSIPVYLTAIVKTCLENLTCHSLDTILS